MLTAQPATIETVTSWHTAFGGLLGVQLLINTEAFLERRFAVTRSSLPSRLKSPAATDTGLLPTPKSVFGPKLPIPSPNSAETVWE